MNIDLIPLPPPRGTVHKKGINWTNVDTAWHCLAGLPVSHSTYMYFPLMVTGSPCVILDSTWSVHYVCPLWNGRGGSHGTCIVYRLPCTFLCSLFVCPFLFNQRHILRDMRPSTTACPACWATGTNKLEKCTMRKKYFVLDRLEQPRPDKNLLYRHDKTNEPTKEGPLSFVLLESPFVSVSTVSRAPLSSLCAF